MDLKFRNETDKYMLVKTSIDSGNLYISIYGPDLGYKVDISDPVIKNKAKPRRTTSIRWTRRCRRARRSRSSSPRVARMSRSRAPSRRKDGNVVRQAVFNTHYQAWPNKFLLSQGRHATEGDQGDDRAEHTGCGDESAHATDETGAIARRRAGDAADQAARRPRQATAQR